MADRENDPQSVPRLPPELIFEILSYLPVISLLRFKTVCKSWRHTIGDPSFIEKHMKRARIAITFGDKDGKPNSNSSLTEESSIILCFIHGLQLEVNDATHTYSIKNPSTKQVLVLPRPEKFVLVMTMCFIPTNKEYKLVYLYFDEVTRDHLGCEVLTIGTDSSWRPIDAPKTPYVPELDKLKHFRVIDGVFYVTKDSTYGDWELICIEMEKEQVVRVNIPRDSFSDWDDIWPLRWNGTALAFVNIVKQRLHVWILEDLKKKRWGENKIDIPLTFLKDFPSLEDFYANAFTDDLFLFVINSEHVIFFSIKSGLVKFTATIPPGKGIFYFNKATLVSLTGMQPVN